jgi:hypothetical protein
MHNTEASILLLFIANPFNHNVADCQYAFL